MCRNGHDDDNSAMAKEIELKLRLTPENTAPLAHWLDQHLSAQGASHLTNHYYDTDDLLLQRQRAALRIRETEDGFEQTLKTRGRSVAGMHIRGEWNWPLKQASLDPTLLRTDDVRACLPDDSDLSSLAVVFGTHFLRRRWIASRGNSRIEVVIDEGEVRVEGERQPLCETELELLEGDAEDLWHLLNDMQAVVPLWLSDVSKAERGYRVAGKAVYWQPPQVVLDDWQTCLSSSLNVMQRAIEDDLFEHKASLRKVLWLSGYPLVGLLPDTASQCLRTLLSALAGSAESNLHQGALALTALSQEIYRVCQSSQAAPVGWETGYAQARSTVADMIECGNDLTTLLRE